jgi:hypothetical protein
MADDTEDLSAFSVLSVSVVLRRRKCEHHGQGVAGDTVAAGRVGLDHTLAELHPPRRLNEGSLIQR